MTTQSTIGHTTRKTNFANLSGSTAILAQGLDLLTLTSAKTDVTLGRDLTNAMIAANLTQGVGIQQNHYGTLLTLDLSLLPTKVLEDGKLIIRGVTIALSGDELIRQGWFKMAKSGTDTAQLWGKYIALGEMQMAAHAIGQIHGLDKRYELIGQAAMDAISQVRIKFGAGGEVKWIVQDKGAIRFTDDADKLHQATPVIAKELGDKIYALVDIQSGRTFILKTDEAGVIEPAILVKGESETQIYAKVRGQIHEGKLHFSPLSELDIVAGPDDINLDLLPRTPDIVSSNFGTEVMIDGESRQIVKADTVPPVVEVDKLPVPAFMIQSGQAEVRTDTR